jgi:hypothetical protein
MDKPTEILEEVWRNRDEFARRHNYDFDSMVAELREMERQPWSRVINREKDLPNDVRIHVARRVTRMFKLAQIKPPHNSGLN